MKIFLKISRITIVVLIAISTVILTTGLASAQYGVVAMVVAEGEKIISVRMVKPVL